MPFVGGVYGPQALLDTNGKPVLGATASVPASYTQTLDALGNLTVTGPAADNVVVTVTPQQGAAFTFPVRVEPFVTQLEARLETARAVGYRTWNGTAWSPVLTGFLYVEHLSDGASTSLRDPAAPAPPGAVVGDRWWKADAVNANLSQVSVFPFTTSSPAFTMFGPEAGGSLTGLYVSDNGTMYTRADVGGAYRKAPGATSAWVQLFTVDGIPAERFDDFYCDAIACSPTDPAQVYAAVGTDATGRVMRSVDSGATWTVPSTTQFYIHGNGEGRYGREPLAVQHDNPAVVYYGTRRDGLHRSTDGAATWTKIAALPAPPASTDFNRLDVTAVFIERASARVAGLAQGLWATVRGQGVYRSTDGGATWVLRHAIAAGSVVKDAVLDSNNALVVAVENPTSFARVPATGAVVALANPIGGEPPGGLTVHPTSPLVVWLSAAGVRDGKLFRSADGGATWTTLNVAITNGADGAVWPLQTNLETYMTVGQIRYDPADLTRLWFAEGMGMWQSNDLADLEVTWVFTSRGVQELVANAIVKPPGTGAVAATWDRGVWKWNAQDKATLPYQGDFCSAWDVQARPDAPLVMAVVMSDHQSADTNPARRLSAITTDGGTTWTRLAGLANGTTATGLRFGTIAISRGNTDNLVWAPAKEFTPDDLVIPLRYSNDRGATWLIPTITPALVTNEQISDAKHNKQRKLVADPNANGKFYALTFNNVSGDAFLLTTVDGGVTWSRVLAGPAGSYAAQYGAALTAVKIGTATHLFWTTGPRGDGIPATQAAGQIEARVSVNGAAFTVLPQIRGAHGLGVGAPITPSTNPTLFTYGWVGTQRGVYRSTDLGQTWTLVVNEPLGWHQGISAICGDPEVPGRVYVGMPGGSYFRGGA